MKNPFKLRPCGKDYLWGGQRLNKEFNKNIDLNPLAETWECSTHPDGVSVVEGGSFDGMLLTQVLEEHPEYLGSRNENLAELPILIKFIDANKDLSVQVHPDDDYAFTHENGQRGKTEMWYVLDASKRATLIYGLNFETTPDDLKKAILDGSVGKLLQKVKVQKDDVFFVPAGLIHAIGAGTMVAEIQENSNLTYRLYDYDRVDKNGNKRELHLDKALAVAKLSPSTAPRQPMRVLRYKPGVATELLGRCRYFEVWRMLLNSQDGILCETDDLAYKVLLCIDGCGEILYEDGRIDFIKGDCVFLPADSVKMKLVGKAQLLEVRG